MAPEQKRDAKQAIKQMHHAGLSVADILLILAETLEDSAEYLTKKYGECQGSAMLSGACGRIRLFADNELNF